MKKLVIDSVETRRYSYTLELTNDYIEKLNNWIQEYYKLCNDKELPYFDADTLVDIWNGKGDLEAINYNREKRGQQPLPELTADYIGVLLEDLYEVIYNLLLDKTWASDADLVSSSRVYYYCRNKK